MLQVSNNQDGTWTLELDSSFGTGSEDTDVQKISFLHLTRLDKDRVTLTHDHHFTILEIAIRTVDA